MHESAIRIEWMHACASRDRWHEEVRLLRAESRRAMKSFTSFVKVWLDRKALLAVSRVNSRGALGYADCQVRVFSVLEAQAKKYNGQLEELAKVWRL
jgi:hypothetical protein